jgi:hypothetical protein
MLKEEECLKIWRIYHKWLSAITVATIVELVLICLASLILMGRYTSTLSVLTIYTGFIFFGPIGCAIVFQWLAVWLLDRWYCKAMIRINYKPENIIYNSSNEEGSHGTDPKVY